MKSENNQQLNQTQLPYHEDEIDLRELFSILWKGKWVIIGVTFIFAIASVGYALYLPNEYKATAVLQPNESGSGGKLASLAGQFGGLASMAGINLGAGESSDAVIAMEIMKSWGFAEEFINKHNIAVELFAAKGWDQSKKKLIIDDDLYNEATETWVREAPKGKTVEPSSWELFEEFKERLSISQDKDTGLVSVSVTHYSPEIAKEWVDMLTEDINKLMKDRALEEANQNIQYLEEQFKSTSYAELRAMFSELIQEQHKSKMLAQVSDEYVFKAVSVAKVPEEKDKPKRSIIVILGILLGSIFSTLIIMLKAFYQKD
ncbi:Wzz/FepE/Etk N-terminal domain-containing protein [Kangiella geojedonensis]|uniref:Lipopolysaccharide biosynthesis protein n=1 Tax=Kangiella geojedonensis TaxID=914150 RepID=A0A0F6TQW4_9GAMM|nr:Wzz/FepE/Etk N-terminal domain-containing protein [Kangiella geojedonensis]AKE52355.1 Lipopolysaccharide biosynthesis protein [Kangiella geojedonensis]